VRWECRTWRRRHHREPARRHCWRRAAVSAIVVIGPDVEVRCQCGARPQRCHAILSLQCLIALNTSVGHDVRRLGQRHANVCRRTRGAACDAHGCRCRAGRDRAEQTRRRSESGASGRGAMRPVASHDGLFSRFTKRRAEHKSTLSAAAHDDQRRRRRLRDNLGVCRPAPGACSSCLRVAHPRLVSECGEGPTRDRRHWRSPLPWEVRTSDRVCRRHECRANASQSRIHPEFPAAVATTWNVASAFEFLP
jgi:hypothetical protein